jgi:hypothetical protein
MVMICHCHTPSQWSIILWIAFILIEFIPEIINHFCGCKHSSDRVQTGDSIFLTSSLFCYLWVPEIQSWSRILVRVIQSGIVSVCGISILTIVREQADDRRSRIRELEEEGRRLRQIANAVNAGIRTGHLVNHEDEGGQE